MYLCGCETPRHTQSTEAITYYLPKDRAPIIATHNRGLKKMINTLNKCYVIPSWNCFSKAVLSVRYTNLGGRIPTDLKKAEHFAIRDLFTGLTVHSISSDLTMTALQTTFPPQEYSIETIGQGLREVLA